MRCHLYWLFLFGLVILSIFIRFRTNLHNFDTRSSALRPTGCCELPISDTFENLFWFIQLSDIHISIYDELSRIEDFETFLRRNVKVIRPELLLVSGDLVDAKSKDKYSSSQLPAEWKIYKSIIRQTNVLDFTRLLDIRGNHDAFNVPNEKSADNYFKSHGVQGHQNSDSYLFNLQLSFGHYSFVALDACPDPGLRRPLNFFGHLTPETEEEIRGYIELTRSSNVTFWFGHYPTSTIVSSLTVRSLIGASAYAYFCGHLHTFMGWVPKMYGLQPQGFFELELGDWRDNRYYRIVAVDHDLVSFVDMKFSSNISSLEWPIILVTNPKHASFLLPHKEPIYRIAQSNHIRILVWSPYSIEYVAVSIDDGPWRNATPARIVQEPTASDFTRSDALFVVPWDPTIWATGSVHTIQVVAQDIENHRRQITQPFMVNGTSPGDFSFIASLFILSDHTFNIRTIFYTLWSCLLGLVLVPRLLSRPLHRHTWCQNRFAVGLFRLSTSDKLVYPLLFYLIYIVTGPIFMGYLVDGHFAVVFSFGVYVAGSLIAESLTYLYESVQILVFCVMVLPVFIWHLGISKPVTAPSPSEPKYSVGTRRSILWTLFAKIHSSPCFVFFTCILYTIVQIFLTLSYIGYPYGMIAFLLSPGRMGPILLVWYLANQTTQL